MLRIPDVLLLDNPFGGLDVASRKLLQGALKNIIKSGKQVIMATNDMDDFFGYFDKVLVFEKGRVTPTQPFSCEEKGFNRQVE